MRFADITGQDDLKRHLAQTVDAGRVSHAQLFTGASGFGTLALAVAYVQYLCCRHRRNGDSCGECPDCRQIEALAHPDLHLVFPVNKQGKKSGEVIRSDEFLPQFRTLFAERRGRSGCSETRMKSVRSHGSSRIFRILFAASSFIVSGSQTSIVL